MPIPLLTLLLFVLGMVLLLGGADLLVRGASRVAAALGISPLVIGLTVVALGTSSAEIAVSVMATLQGQPEIALGNVVGSNTFNVFFILGLSAVITPLVVHRKLVRVDVPIMIIASLLVWYGASDGRVSRPEGVLLLLGLSLFLVFSIITERQEAPQALLTAKARREDRIRRVLLNLLLVVMGLGLLLLGSRWLVDGAVAIARALGISELVIAVTIVAAGTGLPELATSALAALRGERDLAVGNVVGSNVFNLFCVMGLAAALSPEGVVVPPAALAGDIPVMVAAALFCLPIFFSGLCISRWEGCLFLALYAAYASLLVVFPEAPPVWRLFTAGLFLLAFAVTVITFVVSARDRRSRG